MRYKILGFVVWQGARWYARRRLASMLPSRRVVTASAVAGAVGVLAIVAAQRNSSSE